MGLATARILGRDHRIVLADLDQSRIDSAVGELGALGMDATGVVCDITDRASVDQLFDAAEDGGHHVRAVVHTAGISPQMGTPGGIVRINFVSLSATLKDEKGTPVRELRQRVVLTPQGVLELNGAMQQVIEKLISTGVLQRAPQDNTGTISGHLTGVKAPSN